MRNAHLPPVSSQLYNFGNNEVQIPSLEVSMPMDSIVCTNDASIYMETNDNNQQKDGGGFTVSYQSLTNCQPPDYQMLTSSNCDTDNISQQQSILRSNRVSGSEATMDFRACKMKRHSVQVTNLLPERSNNGLIENNATFTGWRNNKRQKTTSSKQEWNLHKHKEPARRSQKLSDKITALQKLVSPYGKTDTAAVLQEASLYIKLLQEQIQNLFEMMSSSQNSLSPLQQSQDIGNQELDLQSRGLCLVPISVTQRITQVKDFLDPTGFRASGF